jgi:hypothetical protein
MDIGVGIKLSVHDDGIHCGDCRYTGGILADFCYLFGEEREPNDKTHLRLDQCLEATDVYLTKVILSKNNAK